jgi:hypothetical protein
VVVHTVQFRIVHLSHVTSRADERCKKNVMKMLKKCPKIGKKCTMVYMYVPTMGST